MVNINKLKGKIVENSLTVEKLADIIHTNKSTLYRKISNNGEALTIKETDLICKALKLSSREVNEIFFSQYVA